MTVLNYEFQATGSERVKQGIDGIDESAKRSQSNQSKRGKKLLKNRARARLRRIRETRRAAQAEERIHKQSIAKQGREEDRAAKASDRRRARMQRGRARARLKRIRETRREAQQAEKLQRRMEEQRSRGRSRARNAVGVGVLAAGAAVAGAGVAVGAAAVRQGLTNEDKARSIAVQSRGAGEKMKDPRQIVREAQRTAIEVGGITAESVLDSMSTFITKTGDAELGAAFSKTFATVARATGADASEIAGAGADLMQKFDIKTVEGMRDAMAALTFQGKEGAFELKDAAAQFPKLASAASRLGGFKGVKGVRELGGLTQIARESTGSSESAATSLEAVFSGLTTNQGELQKSGVNVFNKKGEARPIKDLLVDVVSKVGGDNMAEKKGGLAKIFGRQGIRALSPLIAAYAKATAKGADGAEAVANQLNRAMDAPGTWADVVEDAASMNQSAAAKLTTTWEQIVASASGTLVPAISGIAESFLGLMDNGGLDALGFAFDVAAENVGFFSDALKLAAKVLGPDETSSDRAKALGKEEAALQEKIESKANSKKGILARAGKGKATTEDLDRLSVIDKDLDQLTTERDRVSRERKAEEAAAVKEADALFDGATQTGERSNQREFTDDQFTDAFLEAGEGRYDVRRDENGNVLKDGRAGNEARSIVKQIRAGEDVSTFGLTQKQKDLVNDGQGQVLAGKTGAQQLGPDAIQADESTMVLAEKGAAAGAKLAAFTVQVEAAAAALGKVAKQGGGEGDIGG